MNFVPNSEIDVVVNGITLHTYFFSYDPSKPIGIMLHGHRSDTLRMRPVIAFLEEKYNMICFDLPGFGKSEFCPVDGNYIDICADSLYGFLQQFDLKEKDVFLVGVSLGGNVAVNYLIKHPEADFKKLGLVAPIFSYKYMGMKPMLRKFVFWFAGALKKGGMIAWVANKVINSDKLFTFILKTADKKAYNSKGIIDYEKSQWRLQTMQHWGRTLSDLLTSDYTQLSGTFGLEDVVFVYPEHDQYIDAPKSKEGFKKLFPNARFNSFPSDKHIPKGDFATNPELVRSMKTIVEALG